MKKILIVIFVISTLFLYEARAEESDTNALSAILVHVLSTNTTPLINFKGGVPKVLQVSLPASLSLPISIGNTKLVPYDDSKKATRFWLKILEASITNLIVNVGNTWHEPDKVMFDDGSEHQTLLYEKRDGKWVFTKTLKGTIK